MLASANYLPSVIMFEQIYLSTAVIFTCGSLSKRFPPKNTPSVQIDMKFAAIC